MKKLTLYFLATLFTHLALGQTTKKVLFIGNSYTASNNLPNLIYQSALSTGDTLIYDSNTPGGYRFLNHVTNNTTMNKIFSDNWDFVSLQAQSQEPSFGEAQLQQELLPYAKTLCDTIRANNFCSQPLFFTTWGRKNGDNQNCQFAPWLCTYEGMDSALTATYVRMGIENKTEVSPVGPVWRYIRNNYPDIELYSQDGSHPSLAGSYAAACTFYALIFKKDPTQITWNSNLSPEDAGSIKFAAKEIAFDHLETWDHSDLTPPQPNFTYSVAGDTASFQTDATDIDSLIWNFGDGNLVSTTSPTHIYASNGTYPVSLTVFRCGKASFFTQEVIIDVMSTGLNELRPESFTLSPNPADQFLELHFTEIKNQASITIYNSGGQAISQFKSDRVNDFRMDISELPAGVYVIFITADEQFHSQKIMVY